MSEMKAYNVVVTDECADYICGQKQLAFEAYAAEDADAAIAELKDIAENACLERDDNQNAIDELQDENRSLKRALWLARANRAEARKNYWYVRSIHEGDKDLWSIDGSAVKYIGCIKRSNFDWLKIWSEVERKCRAKAEQYK